jgi:transcriptional regulator GlxA family with amidase domain
MILMDIFDQLVGTIEAPAKPRRFVFVLLEEFTMLCFSAAVESLRIANRMSGRLCAARQELNLSFSMS